MVRILTKDYTELDLTKGFEFQIEMENPMLDEEHIPSAFSTQISFPPSPVNRKVFGYTPAMFLAPNVKRLEASVWIGGVPFVTGTLVYDGIEDGCLMYTFTEKGEDLGEEHPGVRHGFYPKQFRKVLNAFAHKQEQRSCSAIFKGQQIAGIRGTGIWYS